MKLAIRPTFMYNLALRMPRRFRFVISSVSLTILLILATFIDFAQVGYVLPALLIAVYFFTWFAILEGINKTELLVLFIMPIFFTLFAYFFYFLFPVRWLTRLPLIVIYGSSIYAILLTSNIFNVGVEKNIQLYRAAFSVNYLYQTFVVFLGTEVLMSFRLPFYLMALSIFFILYPLALQLLWSVRPQPHLEKTVLFRAFILAILVVQISIPYMFLPLRTTMFSLLVTASYYCLGGLLYHALDNKLFKQTIREYVFVMVFVFVIILLTIPW
ncbi:MAG: hypothetical protein N2691_02485 [Patescibacteria group bacterium]|nr:hypothetical protein [Patescibacteria group bacterium]